MLLQKWKFRVSGTFQRVETGEPVYPCEAIVESGVRDESSPLCLFGTGPVAHATPIGAFASSFVTRGSDTPVECPPTVEVFVRVAAGQWKPYVVSTIPSQCRVVSSTEALLELGIVQIERHQAVYVEP
jgi:hypothetical protein